MIPHEFYKIKAILDTFLGESKKELSDSLQLEYPCPSCRESYGTKEDNKFNLSISLRIMKFNCWKCSTEHDDMHGSVYKLIKLYGSESLLKEYTELISSLRTSELYKLGVEKGEYNIEIYHSEDDSLKLPSNYQKFTPNKYYPAKALEYLKNRGIDWDIISEFNLGFTNIEIGELLNCDPDTVTRRLQKEGIRKHRLPLNKRKNFDYQGLFNDYQNNFPISKLCEKYDLSESVLRRTLKEHNIPNRTN